MSMDFIKKIVEEQQKTDKDSILRFIRTDVPTSELITELTGRDLGVLNFASNEIHRPLNTQLAYAYQQSLAVFVAEQLAPFYLVPDLQYEYRKWDEGLFYNRPKTKRGEDEAPGRIHVESALETADLTGYALSAYLSNTQKGRAITQFGSINAWRETMTKVLTRLLMLDHEMNVQEMYTADSSYETGFTATASPLHSDAAATIREDVRTGERALIGGTCDLIVAPENVYYTWLEHSAITGFSSASGPDRAAIKPAITHPAIENFFNKKVISAEARYNSTPEDGDGTVTHAFIWENYVHIVHVMEDPGGPEMSCPFCRTFILKDGVIPSYKGFGVKSVMETTSYAGGENLMLGYFAKASPYAKKSGYRLKALND